MKGLIFSLTLFFSAQNCFAQIGNVFKGDEKNDTIFFVELDTFSVTARPVHNYNYSRYEAIVKKVYPYADTAVSLLKELNALSFDKKREEKKYKKE